MNDTSDLLYVTSPPEMGSLLARELEELGIPVRREMRGGAYRGGVPCMSVVPHREPGTLAAYVVPSAQ